MTFNEAKKLLKSKNMYFIKENAAFGSLEEYKAKLSDLWADNYTTDDPDEASFDEILAMDEDAEELVKSYYERELDPTEAVVELHDTLSSVPENTEDFEEVVNDEDNIDALDNEDNISYDESDLDNFEDDENYVEDNLEPEEELNFGEAVKYLKQHGYALNEDAQLLLEAWYDNIGLDDTDKLFVQRTMETYASAKSKPRTLGGHRIKGGYMTPAKRADYYGKFEHILELIADRPNATRNMRTVRKEMELLQDDNWYQFIHEKNPDLDQDTIVEIFGHAAIGETADLTPEEAAQRRAERAEAERRAAEAERERQEREAAAERERQRRENPEPEDMITHREFEETPETVTTRRVTRHRMRTVNRNYTDHYAFPAATIKINIDVTGDDESKAEVDEIISAIKDKLRIAYEDDEGKYAMCNVDAAVVDVEEDGATKQEYHVVIKMPAEIKDEITQFAQVELEDSFPFVNSEHPEDSVYEFDNTGNRDEIEDETYEYDEPVVHRGRRRPQTTGARRVSRTPRWRVHYTLADENGRDSRIQRTVIVPAATAEDAKNKVENPEDIDNAYATGVFAVTGVDRV